MFNNFANNFRLCATVVYTKPLNHKTAFTYQKESAPAILCNIEPNHRTFILSSSSLRSLYTSRATYWESLFDLQNMSHTVGNLRQPFRYVEATLYTPAGWYLCAVHQRTSSATPFGSVHRSLTDYKTNQTDVYTIRMHI